MSGGGGGSGEVKLKRRGGEVVGETDRQTDRERQRDDSQMIP